MFILFAFFFNFIISCSRATSVRHAAWKRNIRERGMSVLPARLMSIGEWSEWSLGSILTLA